MTDQAPELHARTLLESIESIGKSAAAIDEAADKLSSAPPSPAPLPTKNGAGAPSK